MLLLVVVVVLKVMGLQLGVLLLKVIRLHLLLRLEVMHLLVWVVLWL